MVSPVKGGISKNARAPLHELAELHLRHFLERSAWRNQLENIRESLEQFPSSHVLEDKNTKISQSFLRERFMDMEERLEEERRQNELLKIALIEERRNRDREIATFNERLDVEIRKNETSKMRITGLLRRIDELGNFLPQKSNA